MARGESVTPSGATKVLSRGGQSMVVAFEPTGVQPVWPWCWPPMQMLLMQRGHAVAVWHEPATPPQFESLVQRPKVSVPTAPFVHTLLFPVR